MKLMGLSLAGQPHFPGELPQIRPPWQTDATPSETKDPNFRLRFFASFGMSEGLYIVIGIDRNLMCKTN